MDCRNLCLMAMTVMFIAAGCRKTDPYEGALGLQSRRVVLSAETGLTPVMVYSNTSWTVKLAPKVSWAGLDRLEGENSSGLYFSYAANYNLARKVALAFEAGEIRDTVWMIQKGGLLNPFITLSPSSLTLGAGDGSGAVAVTSNLSADWKDVEWKVDYIEGDSGWVTDISLSKTSLEFKLKPNGGETVRKAVITVSHCDAEDNVVKTMLTINQNPA